MDTYNSDMTQTLKWLQNNAPNITELIEGFQNWRDVNNTQFWSNWQSSVFNLQTANSFGLVVWCIILGVSNEVVSFNTSRYPFAFGAKRQNFQAPSDSTLTNPNKIGGNFFGSNGKVSGIEEIRFILKLRYAALVSNGRFVFINRMLNYIVNGGENKGSPDDNIVVIDNTAKSVDSPFTTENYWEYRIGKNVTINGSALSSTLIEILNNRDYGIAPSLAGVNYLFVQES